MGHSEVLVTLGRWYVRYAPGLLGKASLAEGLNPQLREHARMRVVRTKFGAKFEVDTQDLIQRYIYLFGVWEPHLTHWLRRRLRPGDTFIDVGANVGYDSILAAGLVGRTGKVVAIEASPVFHRRLLRQAELNGMNNVRTVNAAVADAEKTLTFVLASSHNLGANSIVPYDGPAESTFEINAHPLPVLLDADELARARIIKIDVEGAEGAVIRGLAPALDLLRPDAEIVIEVTPERMVKIGDSIGELLETMESRGFFAYRIANDYAPASYPEAAGGSASGPVRWREPITGETNLIFSRTDAEALR